MHEKCTMRQGEIRNYRLFRRYEMETVIVIYRNDSVASSIKLPQSVRNTTFTSPVVLI